MKKIITTNQTYPPSEIQREVVITQLLLTDMSKLHLPLYKCYPFTYVTRFKFSFKTYLLYL